MRRVKPKQRRGTWKWYSARCLYRLIAVGNPKTMNANFIPGATLVEERIVLVKARSNKEALKKAEKEGRAYAQSNQCTNGYGQKVRARMLKALDVYELFESPSPGVEVFAVTEEIDASVTDEAICERLIGSGEPLDRQEDPWRRFKFIDVGVVRLLLRHSQTSPPSSCPGNKHDR